MNEAAVIAAIAYDAVPYGISVFYEARVGKRIYAERTQSYRNLTGALAIALAECAE